jgi:long-chain acyl-CoA synthetase
VLTHRNIVAATLQAEAWFTPALAKVGDLMRKANSIAALPLYHIFALTLCLLAIRQGSHLTLIPNPRDIPKFVEVLKKRPFHMLPAVNTLFNALLQNPQFRRSTSRSCACRRPAAWPRPRARRKQWQKVTGSTMIEGWGMSETCAIGTNNPVNNTELQRQHRPAAAGHRHRHQGRRRQQRAAGRVGRNLHPRPQRDARLLQPARGERQGLHADGFMRTGDIGIMDAEGYTRIIDRKKDMILVSGFNVFPNELENVISLCPGVLECAAVGVPDEKQGEAIKVFVVRSDPA